MGLTIKDQRSRHQLKKSAEEIFRFSPPTPLSTSVEEIAASACKCRRVFNRIPIQESQVPESR